MADTRHNHWLNEAGQAQRGPRSRRDLRSFCLCCALNVVLPLSLIVATTSSPQAEPLSVPAEFVRTLELPGADNNFLRPAALHIDRAFDEVFVADPGHNRVVVLDENGVYRFELAGGDLFSTPIDIAVDSQGQIYVLASTREGRRVFVFDFDGIYLHEFLPESALDLDIRGVAFDDQDQLLLTDRNSLSIRIHESDGRLVKAVTLLPEASETERRQVVLGSVEVWKNRIFVPISSLGTVHVFDSSGQLIRSIGHFGNNVGEINFPIGVAISKNGLVLVLDKNRFNVVCFDQEGRFLGEFGGKGQREGWYYHPTLLAVDSDERVYIGQVFQNKVEVCSIPDFIAAKNLESVFAEKEFSSP